MRLNPRYVLGVDPGLARCGWAVITRGQNSRLVAAGCVVTSPREPEPRRLVRLARRLRELLVEYRPGIVALEKLYLTKNVSTAMAVGQARGIALLVAAESGLGVEEFSPTAIKLSIAGHGRADKQQVRKMVMVLLKMRQRPRYDDTVDALAIALCGAQYKMVR